MVKTLYQWILVLWAISLDICTPALASGIAEHDAGLNDSLKTFFTMVMNDGVRYNQTHLPSPFKKTTDYMWDNFRDTRSGSYSDFQELKDPQNDKLSKGYIKIRFKLPISLDSARAQEKNLKLSVIPDKHIYAYEMRPSEMLKYECGCLGYELSSPNGLTDLEFTLQIYEDTRYPRWTNLYRWWLPSKLSHINQDHVRIYASWALMGVVEEWIRACVSSSPMADNRFTHIIIDDLVLYLSGQRSGAIAKWNSVHRTLTESFPAWEIVEKSIPFKESDQLSLSELIMHVSSHVRASQRQPLVATLDSLLRRIIQVKALAVPEVDNRPNAALSCVVDSKSLSYLFTKADGRKEGVTQFCYGNGHLAVYFARLQALDPSDREQECMLLIKNYPSLLATLIEYKQRPTFKETLSATNLVQIIQGELRDVQKQLLDLRRLIQQMAPSQIQSEFSEKAAELKPIQKMKAITPQLKEASLYEKLDKLLKDRNFYQQLFRVKISSYPHISTDSGTLNIQFPIDSPPYVEFIKDYRTYLRSYFDASACVVEEPSKLSPLQPKMVRVVGYNGMSWKEKDKLGSLYVNVIVENLKFRCQVNQSTQTTEWLDLVAPIHAELIERLLEASIALGGKTPKAVSLTSGKIPDIRSYLSLLEELPLGAKFFMNYTLENIRLYNMTLDLIKIHSFESHVLGALQFIADHSHELHPVLLACYADCFLMRYNDSSLKSPLGENPDPRLASLLSYILLPDCPYLGRFQGASWDIKEKILIDVVASLQKTLAQLYQYAFKH